MKKLMVLLLTVTAILVSSCAKIYYSPDARTKCTEHQIIAIAPPKVTIEARKKVDKDAVLEQQKLESSNFQKEMHTWLLKRKSQRKILVEILDVETTNAKLKKAGYFDDTPLSPVEICEILGVDAILSSNYSLSKPMSTGGAVALAVFTGVFGITNNTDVTLEIYDKDSKKLLWNYNHSTAGTVGSTPARLVGVLMKHASKKMPYIQ